MNYTIAIWEKRFAHFVQERISYLKWVANGGLMFTLVFLISFSAFYYERFLLWLPKSFPVIPLVSLFLAWLLTRGKVRTLVQQADLVYLTPIGTRMNAYFHKALLYNWVVQGLALFMGILVVYPLMYERMAGHSFSMLILLLIFILLKGGNLAITWQSAKLHERSEHVMLTLIRFITNFMLVFILLGGGSIYLFLISLFPIGYLAVRYVRLRKLAFNWLDLVTCEEKLDARFFRFVNYFVDVPHLEERLNRVPIVPAIAGWLPFTPDFAHHYLYIKLFLRGGTISGMIVRLTLMGALFIWFTPDFYWQLAIALLVLFLSGMQLRSFWPTFHDRFWSRMLPLPTEKKQRAFVTLTFMLMIIQSLVAAAAVLASGGSFSATLLILFAGTIGAFVFCFAWLKKYISTTLEYEASHAATAIK